MSHYIPGQWNFTCDSCGQKLKAGIGRQRWDGFRVCPECWEPRQSLDFVRTKNDNQSVAWSRPKATDVFIYVCDIPSSSCYIGIATVGCSSVGTTFGMTYDEILREYK